MMNRTHSIRQLILAAGLILSILLTGAAGIAFAEEPAAPAEKQAAKVVFEGANPFVTIALYPKPTEENPQPEAIKPEEDGTWLLPAGEYVYTAAAEGFVSVDAAPLSVPAEDAAQDKTITVTLTLQPAQTFAVEEQLFTEEVLPPADAGLTAETMEEAVPAGMDLSAEAINETPVPKAEGPDAVVPEAGNTDDVNPEEELPEEAQSDPVTPDVEEKADSADAADADEGETAEEPEEPAADSTEEAADKASSAGDEEDAGDADKADEADSGNAGDQEDTEAGEADEPDKEASEDGEEQGEEKASEAEETKDEASAVVPAAPVLASGLTYTGEPQSLITAMNPGLWIRIETAAAADDPAGQTAVTGEWTQVEDFENADKAAFSRIDAGTYLVYWYAGEEAPGPQEEGQPAGEVEIARAAAVILVAPH